MRDLANEVKVSARLCTPSILTVCYHVSRYTPNFSKRCTHLIVAGEHSDTSQVKVYLAGVNKDKWQAHAVRLEWLEDCTHNSCQVAEGPYKVEPPSPKVRHAKCHLKCHLWPRQPTSISRCVSPTEVPHSPREAAASGCTYSEQSSLRVWGRCGNCSLLWTSKGRSNGHLWPSSSCLSRLSCETSTMFPLSQVL